MFYSRFALFLLDDLQVDLFIKTSHAAFHANCSDRNKKYNEHKKT